MFASTAVTCAVAVAVTVATFAAAAVLVARNLVHVRVGAAAPLPPCAAFVGVFAAVAAAPAVVVVAFAVVVVALAAVAAVTNVDCLQLAQRCI